MTMQLGLQLSDKPSAQPNAAGVFEPGQPGVWVERVGVKGDRMVYAEVIVAHCDDRYYYGYGVMVKDSGRFGPAKLTGACYSTCYGARDAAIDLIEGWFHSPELCQTVNGERGKTEKNKAAHALRDLFRKEIVCWPPDQDFVDMTDEISTDRMREDGTLWAIEEAA